MFPGKINPRMLKQMQKMMKDFGMDAKDLNVRKVIFIFDDEEWHFDEPKVQVMDVMGIKTYSLTGKPKKVKRDVKVEITEDDIKLVAEQCNVSYEEAKKALEECNGDIAEAILKLENK
ncbi:nascent polypeptide-associated complex protein [Methanocaldococcus villosus KIN24-T80]|uniref:Nascent polypeptide-associated complex protein n=1 Tax=Methanocaldococcus villosus KIN24-T80 TaxID=1069083 RepID=N6VZ47_9EURY|nr:nascent polypeptide-associated complex protein [Methanocaldococcus villosus]ENN96402.1 nascent polypeptide-associated complex protein [Methanocaldococcus villosus KIN24-T80]